MGFGMPIGAWLRGPLKPWADEILRSQRLKDFGLRPAQVQRVWGKHLSGENRLAEIWTVLIWVQWQDKWKAVL